MSLSKYTYNPETCRYEPTRISPTRILGNVIAFGIVTVLLFAGILVLHSELFTTEKGKALRSENTALKKHHASLQQEVASLENVLAQLKQQDAALHEKLFETPPPNSSSNSASHDSKQEILLADASGFSSVLAMLRKKSEAISQVSADRNALFSTMDVTSKDLTFLLSVPSIQPVENAELTRLVSGFGTRIHPFHKGNYHHPGVDLVAPRGTPVMATGNGKVIDITRGSTLQAGYGNYIDIDHGNGIVTRYAHLEDVSVKLGQKVVKGHVIGTVGMSGGAVAPHVHYEIIRDGEQVNPVPFMMEKLSSKEYTELLKLGSKKNQSLD